MDWLTRLPVVGPAADWFFRTRVWHVYEHLDARHWTRLAAAVTFTSFLALFPMLAVAAAVGAAFLSPERMRSLQGWMADQVPGISEQLDLQALVDNAGTVGLVGGALLLVIGVGWAGTLRETLRAVWDLEEDPGNPVLLKVKDLGVLAGLGAVGLLSVAGSTFAVASVGWVAERAGLVEGGIGTVLLRLCGYGAAIATDFLLLWYVLKWLPRVEPPRRSLIAAGLMGAVGFELLKALLGGYLQGVAAKSMYGAFGVPIALLLWISLMAKLLLFCAAWTATASRPVVDLESPDTEPGPDADPGPGSGPVSPVPDGATAEKHPEGPSATGGAPGRRPAPEAPGSRR
jgi:membrane protein